MIVFYVLGGLLALWAVVLAAIGLTRHRFPAGRGAERGVIAISVILVAGAIGSATVSGALEEDEEAEAAAEEGAGAPVPEGALALAADPGGQLAFDAQELQAEAGEVTIAMTNASVAAHDVSLEGSGVDEQGETVSDGGVSTVTAEVEAGEYRFYCSVPGHREGGMEGVLTVK